MNFCQQNFDKSERKFFSFNQDGLPDWNESQYLIFRMIQNITDPKLRNEVTHKISLLKLLHEMEYSEEVNDAVNNFFSDSQYEPMMFESQESNENSFLTDDMDVKSIVMSECTFNLPDLMDSIKSRLGYDENNDNSIVFFNDTYQDYNELTFNSTNEFSDSYNKYLKNSPEECNKVDEKVVKKVQFRTSPLVSRKSQSSSENDNPSYCNNDLFKQDLYLATDKKNSYNEECPNILFATQQFVFNDKNKLDDNCDFLKSPKEDYNFCTLFQTQADFVSNIKYTNKEDEDINIFATQIPLDNSKFITASQFPIPNKGDKFFKVPSLPGIKNSKKPIIPKETFALKKSCTVFESVINRTKDEDNFIKQEIKNAEEDDCNFFESDDTSGRKGSLLELTKNNKEIVIENENDLKIENNENSGIFINRSDLLEVNKNEFCYNTNESETVDSLIEENILIKYAISFLPYKKNEFPLIDKVYIKENEEMFPVTFIDSQYIDRISLETTRLSLTIAELASLNICNKKDNFTEFCSLLKKTRTTMNHIKIFKEQNHFDINKFDNFGMTPLHYAVLSNKLTIVKWLIEDCNHYINPHGGYDAKTPLHLAVILKRTKIIKELCSKIGIDVYAKDIFGFTPIDICDYDEKIKALLNNSKRKSFIKNNYFKLFPKILIDPSLDIKLIKKWKQVPSRKLYEVTSLSKVTTHWITKSLPLDMVKESDSLYEALIRRIYVLHENSIKLILESNSIDQFNIEEKKYIYFKGVLLANGKYEPSNLKEGPKSKLAMKPNLFRGCCFYLHKNGIETKLYNKLQRWILLGEGELLKDKRAIEDVLENRKHVVPFYISKDDTNSFYNNLSSSFFINTFIITDKPCEEWMTNLSNRNLLIKTSEFIKRSIRVLTSPLFPQASNPKTCTIYQIKAPDNYSIKLYFSYFSFLPRSPKCTDYVRIYTTVNTTEISTDTQLFSEYCNNEISSNITFISKYNYLYILFLSETGKSHGFVAYYNILNNNNYKQSAVQYNDYEFETYGLKGNLYSPNAPYYPPNNILAHYYIPAIDGRRLIVNITFFDFPNDSCKSDYLLIKNLRSKELIEKVCSGSKYPLYYISSIGFQIDYKTGKNTLNTLGFTLTFEHQQSEFDSINRKTFFHTQNDNNLLKIFEKTNNFPSIDNIVWYELTKLAASLKIDIQAIAPQSQFLFSIKNNLNDEKSNKICPIKIISSKASNEPKKNEDNQQIVYKEGIFDSQVHGLSNQKCHILFIGAVGEYVQLTFTKFNLEVGLSDYNVNETKGCQDHDHIGVHVLIGSRMSKINDFCESQEPPQLMSPKNIIAIEYIPRESDVLRSQMPNHGFQLKYRFLNDITETVDMGAIKDTSKKCAFIFNMSNHESGTMMSINYPGYYPRNLECEYIFIAQDGYVVAINFDYFDVEGFAGCEDSTQSDYVLFSNYKTIDRTNRRFCGKTKPNSVILSESNYFRMLFKTNDIFDATGFYAHYQFLNTQESNTRIKFSVPVLSNNNSYNVFFNKILTCIFSINILLFIIL
uniref:CUB domain-containing protein n=1 Tax=Strongyloides stercoralis TaxID=6248 RepID=A0AAF5D9C2_STRER